MSEQAEKFLAQWEIWHLKKVARSDREDEAGRLALRCLEDAARAGINSQDLEAAAKGNLIGNMLQALDAKPAVQSPGGSPKARHRRTSCLRQSVIAYRTDSIVQARDSTLLSCGDRQLAGFRFASSGPRPTLFPKITHTI